jgi:hypothetical protein
VRLTQRIRTFGCIFALLLVCFAGSASASSDHRRCDRSQAERCLRAKVLQNRPFGPSSIWSNPLGTGTQLSPLSDVYSKRLASSVRSKGAWVNTTQWSTPVYTVSRRQPTSTVAMNGAFPGYALQDAFNEVPIPRNAVPAADSDAHLVVVQPGTDTMWELWGAYHDPDGWHARYGGRMTDLSQDPGYFPADPGWGATATGLPMVGGLIRISELRAGVLPHALAIAVPEPLAKTYAWPAQRTDGTSLDPQAIPEGTRFRIDPSLDLTKLGLSPFVLTLARAAQKYGFYVADRSDNVAFAAEDPTPTGSNPYWPSSKGFFGGVSPNDLLAQFPWDAVQAVDAPLHCCGR